MSGHLGQSKNHYSLCLYKIPSCLTVKKRFLDDIWYLITLPRDRSHRISSLRGGREWKKAIFLYNLLKTEGGGGSKMQNFRGRPLWMVPNVMLEWPSVPVFTETCNLVSLVVSSHKQWRPPVTNRSSWLQESNGLWLQRTKTSSDRKSSTLFG